MMKTLLWCLAACALLGAPALAQGFSTGFEPPTYAVGSIGGVDGWAILGGQASQSVVQSTYVRGGSQALGIQQLESGTSSVALVHDFASVSSGILKVEYWAMPGDGTDATGVWIAVEQDRSATKRAALFGFRSGLLAYNNGAGWVNSTTAYTVGEWYQLTGVLNYDTRKWDFYVNGSPFASDLGFYHAAHTAATSIRFYKGTNNLGMAVDDITIVPEPSSILALICGLTGIAGLLRRRP